ncbi:ANTAR domain-containing protein [Streptomyces sp. NPDC001982]|uniref:ANTAR domain-containing protein n=1 Tax=Streptomyces sp. NPDC001982 TaxID=3154405 RepID=UPI003322994E
MRQVPHCARAATDDVFAAFADATDTGPGPLLTLDNRTACDRMTVAVCGELDIDVAPELRRALSAALARSVWGIDLDLGGVVFCDCAGLNTLLAIRLQAHHQRKTVVVRAAGPAVRRILTLTGTLPLFSASDDADATEGGDRAEVSGASVARVRAKAPIQVDGTEPELRTEVVQLRRAMQTRPTIDLARGILMAAFGLTAEDAWSVLVMTSQHTNAKLNRVAQGLVDTVSGNALPESVREVLSDAVTKVGTDQAH